MKTHLGVTLIWAVAIAGWTAPAAEPPLSPGKSFTLEFPGVGPTLANQAGNDWSPATMHVGLPADYDAAKTYCLFVLLPSGDGRAVKKAAARARDIIGDDRYVVASLPLFRRPVDRTAKYGGLHVGHDDADVITAAYGLMWDRLFEAVPNLAEDGHAICGSSNGAHTIAALVTAQDEKLLARFDTFVLVEGGFFLSGMFRKPMLEKRFLLLYGGTRGGGSGWWERTHAELRVHEGDFYGVDFNVLEMQGAGHSFPRSFNEPIGRWVRGKPVDVITSQDEFPRWSGTHPTAKE